MVSYLGIIFEASKLIWAAVVVCTGFVRGELVISSAHFLNLGTEPNSVASIYICIIDPFHAPPIPRDTMHMVILNIENTVKSATVTTVVQDIWPIPCVGNFYWTNHISRFYWQ